MFKTINGWTKEKMIKAIKEKNNGTRSTAEHPTLPGEEICAYENEEGNRCAAGVFFPDDHPALKLNGSIAEVLHIHKDLHSYMPLGTHGMNLLQRAHDHCDTNKNVHEVLINFINTEVENG